MYQVLLNILSPVLEWHLSFQIISQVSHVFSKFHSHSNPYFQIVPKNMSAATWGCLQCPSFNVKTAFTAKRCQGISCGDSWQDAMLTVCFACMKILHPEILWFINCHSFPLTRTKKFLGLHNFEVCPHGDHPLSNRNIPFDLAE